MQPKQEAQYNIQQMHVTTQQESIVIDPTQVSNALLKRLIEEVQYDTRNNISAYNRTHNRHNRGR